MKQFKSARAMFITAMSVFGTLGVFVRNISVSSGELALYRAIMAALLLAGYFIVTRQHIDLRSIYKEVPLLLVSGTAMGINWILLFEAYNTQTYPLPHLATTFLPYT